MNQLLLTPTDTLFFRDGRPMDGALSGHGAAWPLPTVTNTALHAALHDAQHSGHLAPDAAHRHDHMRGATRSHAEVRAFGSLLTAGPFPVGPDNTWYFPRPLDLTGDTLAPTLIPTPATGFSSLPDPLTHVLLTNQPPAKNTPSKAWLSATDCHAYLTGSTAEPEHAANDDDIYLAEASIGIAIDPATGTTGQGDAQGKIYSSHSLRLHDGWRIGLLAHTAEKQPDRTRRDLIAGDLYRTGRGHLILGGQQRVCAVERFDAQTPSLPHGLWQPPDFKPMPDGRYLVKWVLLSPSIYPIINAGTSKRGTQRKAHPGGWLPTWIDPISGQVLLETIDDAERARRRKLNYNGQGYASSPNVPGRLVAALVGKPIPVTGWSLGTPDQPSLLPDPSSLGNPIGNPIGNPPSAIGNPASAIRAAGAKPTHLAVPAGSVYYFACDTAEAAAQLAAALNWHGAGSPGATIRNRRSTLLGEKGFGLGVCGTWTPHAFAACP